MVRSARFEGRRSRMTTAVFSLRPAASVCSNGHASVTASGPRAVIARFTAATRAASGHPTTTPNVSPRRAWRQREPSARDDWVDATFRQHPSGWPVPGAEAFVERVGLEAVHLSWRAAARVWSSGSTTTMTPRRSISALLSAPWCALRTRGARPTSWRGTATPIGLVTRAGAGPPVDRLLRCRGWDRRACSPAPAFLRCVQSPRVTGR